MATHKRNAVHVSTGNDKHMWKRWVIRCVDVTGYDRWLATKVDREGREEEIWQWVPTLLVNRYFSKEQAEAKVESLRWSTRASRYGPSASRTRRRGSPQRSSWSRRSMADFSSIEGRLSRMRYKAMTESERAEEAGRNAVSTFDERWVRLAIKCEYKPRSIDFDDRDSDAWVLSHVEAVGKPHAAFVELRCPRCKFNIMITARGLTAKEACDEIVAKVAAHGLECIE